MKKETPILPESNSQTGSGNTVPPNSEAPGEWVQLRCTTDCTLNGYQYKKGHLYLCPPDLKNSKFFASEKPKPAATISIPKKAKR